jgi:hypothetical protein
MNNNETLIEIVILVVFVGIPAIGSAIAGIINAAKKRRDQ